MIAWCERRNLWRRSDAKWWCDPIKLCIPVLLQLVEFARIGRGWMKGNSSRIQQGELNNDRETRRILVTFSSCSSSLFFYIFVGSLCSFHFVPKSTFVSARISHSIYVCNFFFLSSFSHFPLAHFLLAGFTMNVGVKWRFSSVYSIVRSSILINSDVLQQCFYEFQLIDGHICLFIIHYKYMHSYIYLYMYINIHIYFAYFLNCI